MTRVLAVLLLPVGLGACASLQPPSPPLPPPPPAAQFIVPEGTEFVSGLFGYSQAVRVGPWIRVSAQPGFDIEKRGFPETLPEQAEAAFRNLAFVLEASGASLGDVVEITSYQLDMEQFNAVVDARNEAFGEHRPAWTAVGVSALPLPSMQFQVSATAYVPGVAAPVPPPVAAGREAAAKTGTNTPFVTRPGY